MFVSVGRSSGSGFLVGDERWIVTNAHVVRGFEHNPVAVRFGDGDTVRARVLAYDASHDLAIVEAEGEIDASALELGDADRVEVGQNVLAFGSPFGLEGTLTQGIVSARRDLPGIAGNEVHGLIQTDAPINPGNSGGPLVDANGRVIGVNTAILSPSGASNGIGFAVPVTYVKELVDELREHVADRRRDATRRQQAQQREQAQPQPTPQAQGQNNGLGRVWLGVLGEDFSAGGYAGVRVRQVVQGGPAAGAGILGSDDPTPAIVRQLRIPWTGHIILGVDGHAVQTMADLHDALASHRPGDRVVVAVTVGPGIVHGETTVTLSAPPREARSQPAQPRQRRSRRQIRANPRAQQPTP